MSPISHFAKPPCLFGLVIDVNGAEKIFIPGMAVNPTDEYMNSSQKSRRASRAADAAQKLRAWCFTPNR